MINNKYGWNTNRAKINSLTKYVHFTRTLIKLGSLPGYRKTTVRKTSSKAAENSDEDPKTIHRWN